MEGEREGGERGREGGRDEDEVINRAKNTSEAFIQN